MEKKQLQLPEFKEIEVVMTGQTMEIKVVTVTLTCKR